MEPHPIPRQITTFEFKLIGFLTLRQFIYLAIFSALAVVLFYGVPIPFLNMLAAVSAIGAGLAFAFVPVNERPLDVFMKNLIKKLFSPSQYYYMKKNEPLSFLSKKTSPQSQEVLETHHAAHQKLIEYLKQKNQTPRSDDKKQHINHLFSLGDDAFHPPKKDQLSKNNAQPLATAPFLTGVVVNNKNIPLPGILLYVKNQQRELVRILKTNPHGHFATFHPLPYGEYMLEIKDPKDLYFFEAMKINITADKQDPLTITSKELL